MSAAIMRDATISAVSQEKHLIFPGIRAERPSVAEHYRLLFAPVLVVNLCGVFRGDCGHDMLPSSYGSTRFTFNTRLSTDSVVQQTLRRSPFSCMCKGPPPVGFA